MPYCCRGMDPLPCTSETVRSTPYGNLDHVLTLGSLSYGNSAGAGIPAICVLEIASRNTVDLASLWSGLFCYTVG